MLSDEDKVPDDGKKVIIDVMENSWEKWRNRLAYLVIVVSSKVVLEKQL